MLGLAFFRRCESCDNGQHTQCEESSDNEDMMLDAWFCRCCGRSTDQQKQKKEDMECDLTYEST